MALFGLLNINKPSGKPSRWVDDQVKRLARPAKVGHAGTLDPLASGVLLVCIGQATRLADFLQQLSKSYRAEFLLGRTSPTEDITGEVGELADAPLPLRTEIETAARHFVGEIEQSPPAFSALKIAGRRAYKMARKGQAVELAPRPLTIHRLEVLEYEYPRMVLDIQCTSGTYVRSLGRDIAESLGTGAVMSALVRTSIGHFNVLDSIDVATLTRENLADHLLPPSRAVEHLPEITIDDAQRKIIASGQFIPCPDASNPPPIGQQFAALDDRGNLVAVLHVRSDGQLGAARNFEAQ